MNEYRNVYDNLTDGWFIATGSPVYPILNGLCTLVRILHSFQANYDPVFHKSVYSSPSIALGDVLRLTEEAVLTTPSVRVTYDSKTSFKAIAKVLKIMDDFKVKYI